MFTDITEQSFVSASLSSFYPCNKDLSINLRVIICSNSFYLMLVLNLTFKILLIAAGSIPTCGPLLPLSPSLSCLSYTHYNKGRKSHRNDLNK